MSRSGISETPWDTRAFGIATFEVNDPSPDVLASVAEVPGHYTVRVDPLLDKQWLHHHGFYYCDTLIEPWAGRGQFRPVYAPDAGISRQFSRPAMLSLCEDAFAHGRFHRDFNLDKRLANRRYVQWLGQLIDEGGVFALNWRDELAGFFAVKGPKILLHALADGFRGKGLSGYFWSLACQEMFNTGHAEISSSVSAANLAVVNLYASLGFRFRNPGDLYHRVVS